MLEDANVIDIVARDDDGTVRFVALDTNDTPNLKEKSELIDHKLEISYAHLQEEANFSKYGRPTKAILEIRCSYPPGALRDTHKPGSYLAQFDVVCYRAFFASSANRC